MTKQSSLFQRSALTSTLVVLLLLSGCHSMTISDPSTTGFWIIGNADGDTFGDSVKTAGDIDNDGYEDIIIGAYGHNANTGAAYVIYGGPKSSLADIDLRNTTLDPATTGFMISGSNVGDFLGYSVSTAGDINNDGYADIIVGTFKKSEGFVSVIYGGPRSSRTNIDLNSTILDPLTTGFMITGAPLGYFGDSISSAGDINNDGYGDIIIGAIDPTGVGYVIYGGPKSSMSNLDLNLATLDPATTGFMITADVSELSVNTAGDINHDGYDDIIVGVSNENDMKGAAYVIYGGPKSSMSNINLATTIFNPQTTGFVITGGASFNILGLTATTAGDINNDGYADIIVGAPGKNAFTGAAYVIYGGPKSSRSNIDLHSTTLDPLTTGFVITGNAVLDYFGGAASTAGDINKDGYDDIIIGAPAEREIRAGAAYVIYGGPNSAMSNIDLKTSTLDPATTGFMMGGNSSWVEFGYSVSTVGDFNRDGYKDIIVGCPGMKTSSENGGAYVLYGGPKPSMSSLTF